MDKKKEAHRFLAEAWGYDTWTDEDGIVHTLEDGLEEIPLEEFTPFEEEGFIYFQDENVRRYSDENLSSRYNIRNRDSSDEDSTGSVIVRAPTKLSWSSIATIGVIALNLLVAGMAFYFTQNSFNANTQDKLEDLELSHKALIENVYSKREADLRYENVKLEIERNATAVNRLQNRIGE